MTINTITGILSFLIGIGYSYMAWTLPRATVGNPIAPSVFPLMLGLGMTIMGILLLIQEKAWLLKKERKSVSLTLTQYGKSIATVTFLCILYAFFFERLGYLLSTFLFLSSVLSLFNGKERWKSILGVSIGFSVGVYALFGEVLNIQLPRMPFLGL
ncbi:MAG: tripartite tricarboxylate transporter TctB family protein [Spirochaetes bacterium]|nr:tripartite tricarboxylate transporter TctB family protein [Spirochaetota bacterium]